MTFVEGHHSLDMEVFLRARDATVLVLLLTLGASVAAEASHVGRRFPPEKRTVTDAVTGLTLTFLTTDPANDSKPYQTDPTWTADGKWILLRSARGESGPQAFLLHERTGDIVQVTDGVTNTSSLTLSRKTNRMFLMRGGPGRGGQGPVTARELVEVRLDPLLSDALAGTPQPPAAYERVVATLPGDLRVGGIALDADESRVYFGVNVGARPPQSRPPAGTPPAGALPGRREIDDKNMDPQQDREVSRKRFEEAGKGQSRIHSIDVKTGEMKLVLEVPFRLGHLQTNPWVPGELLYCHETTGDAPQRMWVVRAEGTGNRPLYAEGPDEWVTHETFATRDEVMFNLMGHLPYQRAKPTGLAVVNLRTNHMTILDQIEEDMGGGRTGGLWHGNASADGRWAVADSFKGDVYLIDRRNGERILLTTDHKMRPDHAHPIFSPDGKRILIQSGRLTDGQSLDLVVVEVPERPARDRAEAAWTPDRGDGTFRNPVLHADYSDPDVIRVGADYYLVSSSFNAAPGLPILHSRDLVGWTILNHALPRQVPEDVFAVPQHGKGTWAPALRYHAGLFRLYYPDPDFGIYVTTAKDPAGAWSAPVLVKAGKGLIDPCPLFDDDGRAYLVHAWAKSRSGINNILTLVRLNADGTRAIDEGRTIVDGHKLPGYTTLEGPKIYKRAGYYYIFAPAGGVKTGWQSVFRSRQIEGPYEDRIVLEQGKTEVNGPHQGAWVETPKGEHWFFHFQDKEAYGRIVHLQPLRWSADGWPVIGQDNDKDGRGEPGASWPRPDDATDAVLVPQTSDEFGKTVLGPQWQWQANPRPDWSSLTASVGALRLAGTPVVGDSLWTAPQLLFQKWPAPEFTATAALSFSPRAVGERAGLLVFGHDYAWIGLAHTSSGPRLSVRVCRAAKDGTPEEEVAGTDVREASVTLRVTVGAGGRCRFAYSLDGLSFSPLGPEFTARPGHWVGAKVGLFAASPPAAGAQGHADFDWFRITR